MKAMRPTTIMAALALVAVTGGPALAEWRWIDDDWRWVDEPTTQVYEETQVYQQQQPAHVVYEERRVYEHQQPTTYYEERHYAAPVVQHQQVFWDGGCEVTRIQMSDGTTHDERRCSAPSYQIVPPHRLIIDRIGRHFDRMRGYDY